MSNSVNPDELKDLIILARNVAWDKKLDEYTRDSLVFMQKSVDDAKREVVNYVKRRGEDIGNWTKARSEKLVTEYDKLTLGVRSKLVEDIAEISSIAGARSLLEHGDIISFGGRVLKFNPVSMSPEQLKAFVKTTPLGGTPKSKGRTLQNWVDDIFNSSTQKKIKQSMLTSALKGEGYPEIVRNLPRRVGQAFDEISRREMITLTRTYVHSANVSASRAVYKANPDIVKAVKWSATLETGYVKSGRGTCVRCASLDGRYFDVDPLDQKKEVVKPPKDTKTVKRKKLSTKSKSTKSKSTNSVPPGTKTPSPSSINAKDAYDLHNRKLQNFHREVLSSINSSTPDIESPTRIKSNLWQTMQSYSKKMGKAKSTKIESTYKQLLDDEIILFKEFVDEEYDRIVPKFKISDDVLKLKDQELNLIEIQKKLLKTFKTRGGVSEQSWKKSIFEIERNAKFGTGGEGYLYEKLAKLKNMERSFNFARVGLSDGDTYNKIRSELLESMSNFKKLSASDRALWTKNINDGTSYVPYDVLYDMKQSGYKIVVNNGTGRAFYESKKCVLYTKAKNSITTISHEFGHAIDSFWSSSTGTKVGGRWSTYTPYVDSKDAKNYKTWFKKQHSGIKGTYTNGDGQYFKDNWISDYEGRIYSSKGEGTEWWSMNIQRYNNYLLQKSKYGRTDIDAAFRSEWNLVRRQYSELAKFIETKFDPSKRFMLDDLVKVVEPKVLKSKVVPKPVAKKVVPKPVVKKVVPKPAAKKVVPKLTDLEKLYKTKNFSLKENNIIHKYVGTKPGLDINWSFDLGEKLRNRGFSKLTKVEKSDVKLLDSVLSKTKTTKDMTVYRGLNFINNDLEKLLSKGKFLDDSNFLSTSISKSNAYPYGTSGGILEIKVPKGSKGFYIGGSTDEFLLPRNSKLKILGTFKKHNGVPVYTAELVDSSSPIIKKVVKKIIPKPVVKKVVPKPVVKKVVPKPAAKKVVPKPAAKKPISELDTISILNNDQDKLLKNAYFDIEDNPKLWEINFGLSDNNILAFQKNKLVGWIKFDRLYQHEDILTVSFDIRKNIKNKNQILKSLFKNLDKEMKKMDGLKYFKSEFATVEGRKAGNLFARRYNLEILDTKKGYKPITTKPVVKKVVPKPVAKKVVPEITTTTKTNFYPMFGDVRNEWLKSSKTLINKNDWDTKAAIEMYKGHAFKEINEHLRTGKAISKFLKESEQNLEKLIRKSLVPQDVVVYRGINDQKYFNKLKNLVGKTYTEKSYTSTSINNTVAKEFSGGVGILEIRVPKGTKGLLTEGVISTPSSAKEMEILLQKGTKFKVISSGKTKYLGERIEKLVLEIIL